MFRADNTDHVTDVSIGDTVDIICPRYPPDFPVDQMEHHVVYQVSREEFESCRVTNLGSKTTRQILTCNNPHHEQIYTISFREFTPIPMGLEFQRGRDYYYISTSNGSINGVGNLSGGSCLHNNMRLIFKVCCRPSPSTSSSPTEEETHLEREHEAIVKSTEAAVVTTTTVSETSSLLNKLKPTRASLSTTTWKKYHEVEISQNDVSPKAGATFLNSARRGSPSQNAVLVISILSILLMKNFL